MHCYFLLCINVCVSVTSEGSDIKSKKEKWAEEPCATQSRYLKFLNIKRYLSNILPVGLETYLCKYAICWSKSISPVYEIICINDTWSGINIFLLCLSCLFNLEIPTSLCSFQHCNINTDMKRHDGISASCLSPKKLYQSCTNFSGLVTFVILNGIK